MAIKDFYSTGEVSQLLNISRATVSRKFDAGILYGRKNPITGERLISRESLISFMRQYNLTLRDMEKCDQASLLLGSNDEQLQSLVNQSFSKDDRIKIDTFSSGYDALIMCSKNPPDLFIIDEELPDIICSDAVRSLKRLDELNKIKVLCCLNTYNLEKFMEIGADDYLAKDTLEEFELVRKVTTLLNIAKEIQPSGARFDHRRRWPRITLNLPAHLEVYRVKTPHKREPGKARVENISVGGAYISQINLEKGNIPSDTFRFLLEVDQPPLKGWHAECKVARLQTNGALNAGVQFLNLSPENKKNIASLIV